MNTSAVREALQNLQEKFTWMYRWRAYLHLVQDRCDTLEWTEWEGNLADLCSEYVLHWGVDLEDWDEGEESEDEFY